MADNYVSPQAKPANDAYTGMLAISLLSLLVGCAVLYFDYAQYPSSPPPKANYTFSGRPAHDPSDRKKAAEAVPDENPDTGDAKKDDPGKKDGRFH